MILLMPSKESKLLAKAMEMENYNNQAWRRQKCE